MKFNIDRKEKYTVFSVQEETLTSQIAPNLKAEFINIYQSGIQNLIVDLSAVKYIDSSGLSALLMANRVSQSSKGSFIIIGATGHVKKLIDVSKLDKVMTFIPTLEEATDFIFMQSLENELNLGKDSNNIDI